MLQVILRCTDALSRFLQSENMDVFLTRKTANGEVSTLKALKNDRNFILLWALAEKLAEEIKRVNSDVVAFTFKEPQQPRRRVFPRRIVEREPITEFSSPQDCYQETLFYPTIVKIVKRIRSKI